MADHDACGNLKYTPPSRNKYFHRALLVYVRRKMEDGDYVTRSAKFEL